MTQTIRSGAAQRRRRPEGVEYALYFGLIFIISLPIALVRWVMPRREAFGRTRRSILGEAWAMANNATPALFSA